MESFPSASGRVSVAAIVVALAVASTPSHAHARPAKSMPGEEDVVGDELPGEEGEGAPDGEPSADEDSAEQKGAEAGGAGATGAEGAAEAGDAAEGVVEEERGTIGRGPPIQTELPEIQHKKLRERDEPLVEDLDFRITGSVSFSFNYRSWPKAQVAGEAFRPGAEGPQALFERVGFGFDGFYKGLVVSAEYRFYRKYATVHHGYIGYKHGDVFEFDAGVHRVPFGILPYASHNWFETLPYYLGLADDYDLGFKSIIRKGGLNVQLAYYIQAEPSQFGATMDSARYSYDVVKTDQAELCDPYLDSTSTHPVDPCDFGGAAANNEEKHNGVARFAYEWQHRGEDRTEIGASGQFGGLYNSDTERFGTRWAAALHYTGTYRGFNFQLEGLYYDNRPQNPTGQSRRWLTLGAWDAPYRVARRGAVAVGNIAYKLKLANRVVDSIMFYNDHSFLWKPDDGFDYTQMNVTGVLIAARYVYIYLDAATGRNHPWFSPEYSNALAEGEDDPSWWMWLNLSVGFYM